GAREIALSVGGERREGKECAGNSQAQKLRRHRTIPPNAEEHEAKRIFAAIKRRSLLSQNAGIERLPEAAGMRGAGVEAAEFARLQAHDVGVGSKRLPLRRADRNR